MPPPSAMKSDTYSKHSSAWRISINVCHSPTSLTKSVRFLTYAIASRTCSSNTKGGGGAKEYLKVNSWTRKASSCVYLRSMIMTRRDETLSVYRRVDGVLVVARARCALDAVAVPTSTHARGHAQD